LTREEVYGDPFVSTFFYRRENGGANLSLEMAKELKSISKGG